MIVQWWSCVVRRALRALASQPPEHGTRTRTDGATSGISTRSPRAIDARRTRAAGAHRADFRHIVEVREDQTQVLGGGRRVH